MWAKQHLWLNFDANGMITASFASDRHAWALHQAPGLFISEFAVDDHAPLHTDGLSNYYCLQKDDPERANTPGDYVCDSIDVAINEQYQRDQDNNIRPPIPPVPHPVPTHAPPSPEVQTVPPLNGPPPGVPPWAPRPTTFVSHNPDSLMGVTVYRKVTITLASSAYEVASANPDTGDPGDTVMLSWTCPIAIRLWINHIAVVDSNGDDLFLDSAGPISFPLPGQYIVSINEPRYVAAPITIHASLRVPSPLMTEGVRER